MIYTQTIQIHLRFIWTRFVMMALGIWLIVTPATFNQHSAVIAFDDLICGFLVIILSFLAISPYRLWAPWVICAIGVWLQLAPLFFWAPNAVSYLNDTSCGALLILLSIIIPGTPGGIELEGAEIPKGWTYNPSSWSQRIPIIGLAFLAWMSARYMTAYQLGYIDTVWDPFFSNGTQEVISSKLSKSFPISDAGLGTFVYTMEVLMGFKGRTRRWYTMPWIVLLFGIMVVPAGLVSIILIMLQPLIVGYWCSWCLFTAICMLLMVALTVDEVVAVCQYLIGLKRQKKPFWKTFWRGGESQEGQLDERLPVFTESLSKNFNAMTWGITFPWNLLFSIVLGGVLMFTPTFLKIQGFLANSDYIIGALVVTIAFISLAEVIRAVRFFNIVLSLIVILISLFSNSNTVMLIFHLFWGILLICASCPKGKILEKYGNWDKYIF